MTTLFVGDFRTKQLQQYIDKMQDSTANYMYLIEDNADTAWLTDSLYSQLPQLAVAKANIIIMLGFIDCLHSCIQSSYNIASVAKSYTNTINALVAEYPNIKFYVCSVAPILVKDRPIEYQTASVHTDDLLRKIEQFNTELLSNCKASCIDIYDYLKSTSFNTRDGIRFTSSTCACLLNYISSFINEVVLAYTLSPIRNTEADAPDPADESFLYWKHTSAGGYNKCIKVLNGAVLPNCVGYAWGRFMEILGNSPSFDPETEDPVPTLSTSNAGLWYKKTSDGYERGQEPRVGAVICWEKPGAAGHVAIVEEVKDDGSIVTSESGWRDKVEYDPVAHFWVSHRTNTDGHWGASKNGYIFQGFIYNPAVTPGGIVEPVSKEQVTSKNASLTESEMKTNAKYIWNYLGTKGWTLNAVAGMLGNMEHESKINPGRLESGVGPGRGLVQWTASGGGKNPLLAWCDLHNPPLVWDDIDAQLEKIEDERANGGQYYKNKYKYTFNTFSKSLDDPYTLACAFAFDYERSAVALWGFHQKNCNSNCPTTSTIRCRSCYENLHGSAAAETQAEINREALRNKRGTSAREWYNFLAPYAPGFDNKFIVTGLKTDNISITAVTASFIVCMGSSGYCEVLDVDNKVISSINLDNEIMSEDNKPKVVTFTVDKLKPNTEYTLALYITSKETGESTLKNFLAFKTTQDYPKALKNIKLITADNTLPHDKFKIVTSPLSTNDWGYWKKSGKYGYCIQLIVNGNTVEEKSVASITDSFDITLSKYFTKYTQKIGDTVQIGIYAWTRDQNNNVIYNSDNIRTSNPVCSKVKPVIAYLNID